VGKNFKVKNLSYYTGESPKPREQNRPLQSKFIALSYGLRGYVELFRVINSILCGYTNAVMGK
jgi:hypothetical protein